MTVFPLYEDTSTHHLLGKSQLPFFATFKTLHANIPLHHHNYAELSFVIDGKGTEVLNGRPHQLQSGTFTFLLPHHIHEIHVEEPIRKYSCMFDADILFDSPSDQQLGQLLLQTGTELPSHYDLNEEQSKHVSRILEQLLHEYNDENFAKDVLIRAKLMELFVYVIRTQQDVAQKPAAPCKSENQILEVLRYMHLHYHDNLTLSGVAEMFNWNASYMSRVFKQSTGKTFTEYLHFLRIGRAASLLTGTSMKITDISVEVGFDNTRTFNRVFKEMKGVTPSQFRMYSKMQRAADSV